MLKRPEPVLVVDLFPALQAGLCDLLEGLSTADWQQPVDDWTVKDVALHLLGGEVGILSRRRDEYTPEAKAIQSWEALVEFINEINDLWVKGSRRISPRLLCDLLRWLAPQVFDYFKSLDPLAPGGPVSWAGPEPAPVWLDLAREYTERWYHQQQIRDRVGKPGFKERAYFAPILATYVYALPQTFRAVEAENGTALTLTITGAAGASWSLLREDQQWILYAGSSPAPQAEVSMDQDVAWRLFTKGIGKAEARGLATLRGDEGLGSKLFDSVAIIA
jgi:hypothetical protein